TGDGLVWVIHELVQLKDRMNRQDIQDITDRFIESQVLVPGKWKPMMKDEITGRSARARYLRRIQQTLEIYRELI
ncbi:MAG: hypothetical protein OEU95_08500, partial [Nitrospirota bacterium]|nr:hypothetical protein [Nitrospirota bacterium]